MLSPLGSRIVVERIKEGLIVQGTILRVGPECTTLYPNQTIYFLPNTAVTINGLLVLNESDAIALEEQDE